MIFFFFRMSYFCNNIPANIFYPAFGTKTLTTERTTNSCNEFRTSSKALLDKAQNQGGSTVVLERTFSKYFGRCSEVSQKFNDTSIIFKNYSFDYLLT